MEVKQPGVFVTELPSFPRTIVGVATAVPIFIGYTEFAGDPVTGATAYGKPLRISSMQQYDAQFGGPPPMNVDVVLASSGVKADAPDFVASYIAGAGQPAGPTSFTLRFRATAGGPTRFNLYRTLQAFFANGGDDCYIVAAGSYWANKTPVAAPDPDDAPNWPLTIIAAADLLKGVSAAGTIVGPTMTVVPEACQLATTDGNAWTHNGYDAVVQAMLAQAADLKDRVAIIDPPACQSATTAAALTAGRTALADAIKPATGAASYGASYGPAVNASVVSPRDISFSCLVSDDNSVINNILTTQAASLYAGAALAQAKAAIATAFPLPKGLTGDPFSSDDAAYPARATNQTRGQWQRALDQVLVGSLPVFNDIVALVTASLNVLPPSGLLAGIWSANDARVGVWNSPANVPLASVTSLLCNTGDQGEGEFNTPPDGVAINLLRSFPSRGNLVWGARTLDGNGSEFRYIAIRRTMIYVEQSIRLALTSYVFEPNTALTWSVATAAISGFLHDLWSRGGLLGTKASEAFAVRCGLGSSMTARDVADGVMIVELHLQVIRAGEYIVLRVRQAVAT